LDTLSIDDDFFDLGGDSLLAARLFTQIEQDFGRTLSLDLLLECSTIQALAALLQHSRPDAPSPSLVTIQQGTIQQGTAHHGSAPAPLFCLPGIGGNVLEFRAMARRLGPEYTLLGLRPAGFDGQLTHEWSVPEIAAQAIQQMRALQPRGPYYLAGYSCGGVLAFEIAQQLTDQGEKVATLALLDSDLSTTSPYLSLVARLRLHLRTLWTGADGGRWSYLRSRFRLLAERLRRGNMHHEDEDVLIGLDLSPASLEVARLHLAALRNYHPRVYNGRITLFVAQQTADASLRAGCSDPTLGWSRWTREPVEMHLAPGTHAEILQRKELQLLAHKLHHTPGEGPLRPPNSLRPALA
jgi:thioesterase domain-containing protein/acyl carrier protein